MEKLKINNVAQTARTMPTFDLMNKNEQMCLEHNKKFCYSCKTCNSEICIDCLTNPAKVKNDINDSIVDIDFKDIINEKIIKRWS